MKTIDEIEKLSMEDLERISLDENIPVPGDLESNLRSLSLSKGLRSGRLTNRVIAIAASLLIVAGIGLAWFNRSKPLEDTFDDPALAYAKVEETLMKFSESMEIGVKSVEKGREIMLKPTEVFHTMNNGQTNK